MINNSQLKIYIFFLILVNSLGLFSPIFSSNDASFYSLIAKHIYLSNDFINLTFAGKDWLDKPHFPFWLTAISYRIFGINTFSYIFPGFIFNILGAFYTFKLSKYLYDYKTGLIASLLYLSTLHLMISSIDVRAEAYLVGEIMIATYYWLLYFEEKKLNIRYLLLASLMTALAIMTKGVFLIVPIFSGIFFLALYQKKLSTYLSFKWLIALILIIIFTLPELVSLYIQFDSKPDKVVFNQTNISGIKFFLIDSQFGRFLNNGPITTSHHISFSHYFFFLHTFLWAFLPWTFIFIAAIIHGFKNLNKNYIFLVSSFFITFILFSLSNFQLDYYINIVFPFANIICASWLSNKEKFKSYTQTIISCLLIIIAIILNIVIFKEINIFLNLSLICSSIFFIKTKRVILFSIFSISIIFYTLISINNNLYIKYNAGYNIAKFLNKLPKELILDYKLNLNNLEFYSNNSYLRIDNLNVLDKYKKPLYLIINKNDYIYGHIKKQELIYLGSFKEVDQNKLANFLINPKKVEVNDILVFNVRP